MNKNYLIFTISIVLSIIVGIIVYNIVNKEDKNIGLNETSQNLVEISEVNEDAVTDECLDEWNDYNEFSVENGKINIEYALRGVQIQFNIGRENGIILYNNYIGDLEKGVNYLDIKDNKDYTMPKYTFVKVNEDLVFNSEIQRAFMFSEINS